MTKRKSAYLLLLLMKHSKTPASCPEGMNELSAISKSLSEGCHNSPLLIGVHMSKKNCIKKPLSGFNTTAMIKMKDKYKRNIRKGN